MRILRLFSDLQNRQIHTKDASPLRRLCFYVAGLLIFACAAEGFVRRYDRLFYAASHRALTKAAIFDDHPQVDFLFLGTSRTQDGVSPNLLRKALGEMFPQHPTYHAFNAAFTGSSIEALESLAARYSERTSLKLVLIELSAPQLGNLPAPWEESPPATAADLEGRLAQWMQSVRLVRYRHSLVSDNLSRLPSLLLFSRHLTGWETKGSDQIAAWLGKEETPARDFNPAHWIPSKVTPNRARQTLEAKLETQVDRMSSIARLYHNRNISVVFVVPPLDPGFQEAPERKDWGAFFSEVARRSESEVWDFSAASAPSRFFRDPSHLSAEGRAHFSRALAIPLEQWIKTHDR